jgi:stage III sporulation protein SpoIIIAA
MQEHRITDDLEVLLNVLPSSIVGPLRRIGRFSELIEIVLDLGRPPEARYVTAEQGSGGSATIVREETLYLRDGEVTREDIDFVVARIRDFDDDNRAGITRTLHRISGIKNRRQEVVGLTCRVGRAVFGTLGIIEDLIKAGKSVLLLGRPGVGKTTMLREAARILADNRRVVIVDTSNEIGGDGDIPHPAVGRARRMQVSTPSRQHEVMIEAVENHNPQVIVIDEIGREQEAEAARTIAERGVQLIGTAHGQTLENLMMNPTLSDLIGGIESVTLSDEEARRRGTQKTVLERRAPPTFDVLIELRDRHRVLVHHSVSDAVDALLRNKMPMAELRYWDDDGAVKIEKVRIARSEREQDADEEQYMSRRDARKARYEQQRGATANRPQRQGDDMRVLPLDDLDRIDTTSPRDAARDPLRHAVPDTTGPRARTLGLDGALYAATDDEDGMDDAPFVATQQNGRKLLMIYVFGVSKNRMRQAIKSLGVNAVVTDTLEGANVLITAKAYYRQRPRIISDAEQMNIPIYVLRSNSLTQMENCLADLFSLTEEDREPVEAAMREIDVAIQRVLSGERSVDLSPQNSFVRRQQHERAREMKLVSHSYGKDPMRHVRIFRE